MKILIIDDDTFYIQKLKKDLSDYFNQTVDRIHFYCFLEMPQDHSLEKYYDLAFVDIDLNGQNGILVAKEIKEKNICHKIIFVSMHNHLIFDTLSIQPYYFLRKSSYDLDLKMLFNLFKNDFKTKKVIEIHSYSGNYIINKDDILYIEAAGRNVHIYTIEGKYDDKSYLSDFIAYLDDKLLVQTHRSFFVNMSHVAGHDAEFVFMEYGHKVPLSRSFKNAFLLKYKEKLLW